MPGEYLQSILDIDNRSYAVFRRLRVDSKDPRVSKAVFKVIFKFKNLPKGVNKYLSMIPIPFLVGLSGFREKYWTISKDGYFQGIYQWRSERSAKNYPNSFIYKLMTKRAAPGTIQYKVIPNMELSDYIEKHIQK